MLTDGTSNTAAISEHFRETSERDHDELSDTYRPGNYPSPPIKRSDWCLAAYP